MFIVKSRFIKNLLLVFLAIVTGVGVAVYRIVNWGKEDATIVNGVWQANRKMDLGNDKLLTARVAFAALFALKPSEVIYMVADRDNEGNLFSSANEYVITGQPIDARYWSITLYGSDYFLVPNEVDCFSFNRSNVQFNQDSSFSIQVSSKPKKENWLPSGEEEQFYLLLRMYHPARQIYDNIESIKLPDIQKVNTIR